MPTYRRAHLIGESIAAIRRQTLDDFELLIRDDGAGDDGTEAAVRAAADGDSRIHYHRNVRNLKMPANLNDGIRASAGRYVAVCHDHDLPKPGYLSTLVQLLEKHPTALYAHCAIELVDQAGAPTGACHVGEWPEFLDGGSWGRLLLQSLSCSVCALTVAPRATYERFGLYDKTYGFVSDIEMWMRLAEVGDVAYAATPLVQVRTREDDHDIVGDPWPALAATFAIHRRYLERRFAGIDCLLRRASLEREVASVVGREVLWRLRHRKPVSLGRSTAAWCGWPRLG
jgi:glycosyltransferase involved in cell wall biosynthesis